MTWRAAEAGTETDHSFITIRKQNTYHHTLLTIFKGTPDNFP